MRRRMIIGIFLLIGAGIGLFKEWISLIVGLGLVVLAILILLRKGADVYWWGKDKGKW